MDQDEIKVQFLAMAALPDHEIDLATAALLIAATEYPQLDVGQQLGVLDSLSAGASHRLEADRDPLFSVNTLSEYLFDEVGFRGNLEDYYDPRNCFLNEVLGRRLGIPITLSLLCIEVGKRLGIPLAGVGMPGHFLLRHQEEEDLIIDPFHKGILLTEEECAQRLRQVTRTDAPWDSRYLSPVSNREFIARILRNLKNIYFEGQDYVRALTIIERLMALQPEVAQERRDRGVAHYQLGRYQEALDDLLGYLDAAPNGSDSEEVKRLVGHIRDLQRG